MLYYLCCKNKTCCLFSLQERHRRAAVFYFSEIAWPRAPATTAEWLKLSTVTGSGALKKQVLLVFLPSRLSEDELGCGPESCANSSFLFPREAAYAFNHVFVLLLKKNNNKKAFCLHMHEVFLGRKCVALFPLINCSPPVNEKKVDPSSCGLLTEQIRPSTSGLTVCSFVQLVSF